MNNRHLAAYLAAILFAIASILAIAATARADNCRVQNVRLSHINQNVVTLDTGLAIVPYAIPVAVPVVPTTQGLYSYQATAQAYQPRAQEQPQSDEQALYREFLEWRAKRAAVTAQAEPVSPFAATCVKCHSQGGTGFAHHDFSKPLTSDDKLAAIASIMSGKMPKNKPLDPQVRSDIVAELSGVGEPKVKAAVVPPQPSGESK